MVSWLRFIEQIAYMYHPNNYPPRERTKRKIMIMISLRGMFHKRISVSSTQTIHEHQPLPQQRPLKHQKKQQRLKKEE